MSEVNFKGLCPCCKEEEIYSMTLTNGLCLNCYQEMKDGYRQADIEDEYDYTERQGIW